MKTTVVNKFDGVAKGSVKDISPLAHAKLCEFAQFLYNRTGKAGIHSVIELIRLTPMEDADENKKTFRTHVTVIIAYESGPEGTTLRKEAYRRVILGSANPEFVGKEVDRVMVAISNAFTGLQLECERVRGVFAHYAQAALLPLPQQ